MQIPYLLYMTMDREEKGGGRGEDDNSQMTKVKGGVLHNANYHC